MGNFCDRRNKVLSDNEQEDTVGENEEEYIKMGKLSEGDHKILPKEQNELENLLKNFDGIKAEKYKKNFKKRTFLDKLKLLKNVCAELIYECLILYNLLIYDKNTLGAPEIGVIIFALGYFISPVDLIPDQIPFVGYLDDAVVIKFVINQLKTKVTKKHKIYAVNFLKNSLGIDFNPKDD